MAHFAKVNENRVVKVLVAEEEFFDTYVDDSPGYWIQCSYNTSGGFITTMKLKSLQLTNQRP